jgi:4-hydroxy-tetrahydrodipicolinate reductase
MCNTFISGATGKVGRILVERVLEDLDLKLVGGSASKESKDLGKDLGALIGKSIININLTEGISARKDIDLIIDFSRPQNSIQVLKFARKENIPMLIGTTGFNEDELNEINEISKEIPLLIASNTSMGIALFKKIIDYSKEVLNVASSVEIHEQHHEEKKDSPSGTAINLKDQLKEILPNKDIHIVSSREGDSPGVHTIKLSFEDETLEISHKASDRSIFAKGAIIAGKWLKDKPPGLYTMQDIYS